MVCKAGVGDGFGNIYVCFRWLEVDEWVVVLSLTLETQSVNIQIK